MLFYIRLLNAENKYVPNIKNTCEDSKKHKKQLWLAHKNNN